MKITNRTHQTTETIKEIFRLQQVAAFATIFSFAAMTDQRVITPNCYLPPIAYFAVLLNSKNFVIEKHENFVKSTWRNRAEIAGTNSILKISVPIEGGKSHRQLYRDVKINYDSHWQKIHWQTLGSCYRRSAYFEYYEEKLAPFYEKQPKYLFDFNTELLLLILGFLKADYSPAFTDEYKKNFDDNTKDLRNSFKSSMDTNLPGFNFNAPKYFQCFEKNTGFLPNLSVLDILFSEGPNAKNLIAGSLIKL